MSTYNDHQILVNKILVELSKDPDIRCWPNTTGVAKSFDDSERIIKFGLVGSSDILGIIGPTGKFLAIEVKTGNARQSVQQQNFQRTIISRGGVYILARSVLDAVQGVAAARTVMSNLT